ncbi:MAG: hypothetical protein ISR65_11740 [Bacteriovoracaceae bacterium]|nr:hypothetical protein [Bacteriovoracaceae bacterium]
MYQLLNLFSNIPNINDYNWYGGAPHKSLWKRMFSLYPINLAKNGSLMLLNYDLLLKLWEKNLLTSIFYKKHNKLYLCKDDQLVTNSSIDQIQLLTHARLTTSPREVVQIKVHTLGGTPVYSKITYGKNNSVDCIKGLMQKIQTIIHHTKTQGQNIVEIQINHTHPSLDFIANEGDNLKFILNGLGKQDCITGAQLCQFIDYPLTISAITPGQLTYSKTWS